MAGRLHYRRLLPARIPVRLPKRDANQKWLAALVIAIVSAALAIGLRHTAVVSDPMGEFEELLYDSVYRLRNHDGKSPGNVVIVAIDQDSLTKLNEKALDDVQVAWPWPRELYGDMVQYFEKCGAKVVAFDVVFSEADRQSAQLTDETFAELVAEAKIPVVFGTIVTAQGVPGPFAPPVKNPIFGAVNNRPGTLRYHEPLFNGHPSLAYRAATLFAGSPPVQRNKFFLHYYGPHKDPSGRTIFPYVNAFNVLAATRGVTAAAPAELFKGKIVLVGGTAPTLYDAKTTPLDDLYPGVEWQATAAENVLASQRVRGIPGWISALVTFVGAFSVASGALLSRLAWVKVMWAAGTTVIVFCAGILLFHGRTIYWLPLAAPLVALLFATVGGFAWSYFTEGRQRMFFSNAFALATSPEVAAAIDLDREQLKLGGQRREVTIMFTDLAGFTDFAESMDVEALTAVIQTYMEAMSEVIVGQGGYLDKYIGDAIMSTWNGLTDQAEHAASACRAALGIKRREAEIGPELSAVAGAKVLTRVGVHTGRVAFGNLGSSRKLQITVLGDSVNLAARLEPANKIYGTELMISQNTAEQLEGRFVVRELDRLAVKGKSIPMSVYELIAEGPATEEQRELLELYATGLAHYRSQRWNDAEAAFNELLRRFPTDGPAAAMLRRIPSLREAGLPQDWDGVYRAKEK